MSERRDTTVLERLAVARLQHTVNELQIKVANERNLQPPVRNIYHCVVDDSALTAHIPELKHWIGEGSIKMIVPLAALDALDKVKKGTEEINIHARESIRYFDRVQNPTNRRAINGVKIQGPAERFSNWDEAVAKFPPVAPLLEGPNGEPEVAPPSFIQQTLNCLMFFLHQRSETPQLNAGDKLILVTNDDATTTWANVYGLATAPSYKLEGMIRKEEIEFLERKRHYEYAQANPPASSSPVRGGRGHSRGASFSNRSERGGFHGSGGGRRLSRSESYDEKSTHAYRQTRNSSPPDYVLRSPSRGVARGRGRLWEP